MKILVFLLTLLAPVAGLAATATGAEDFDGTTNAYLADAGTSLDEAASGGACWARPVNATADMTVYYEGDNTSSNRDYEWAFLQGTETSPADPLRVEGKIGGGGATGIYAPNNPYSANEWVFVWYYFSTISGAAGMDGSENTGANSEGITGFNQVTLGLRDDSGPDTPFEGELAYCIITDGGLGIRVTGNSTSELSIGVMPRMREYRYSVSTANRSAGTPYAGGGTTDFVYPMDGRRNGSSQVPSLRGDHPLAVGSGVTSVATSPPVFQFIGSSK